MILVTFAVAFESAAFRRLPVSRTVRILHTGVGADSARAALEAGLCAEIPERVIVAGFAGALVSRLAVGDLVTDDTARLVSAPAVLTTSAAKRAFRAETGAEAVDMETDAIREVCAVAGVPVTTLRVVSDGATDDLGLPSDLLEALSARPMTAAPRLIGMLLTEPERRRAFLRLVRDCRQAQKALAEALATELAIRP